MVKVSIIIPIYNSEKYLSKCLDSIIHQTYKNIEIIAVNDGSTDNSVKILNTYKGKLILHNQENQGISAARNIGMKLATGKYIIFIDHDDYIKSNYVESLVTIAESKNADVVISDYKKVDENDKVLKKIQLKKDKYAHFFQTMPWAKVYRKSFLENNNIKFLDTNIMEDICFNMMLYTYNPKIIITNYCGYYWFYNKSSVSNTFYKAFNKDANLLKTLTNLKNKIKTNEEESEIYNYIFIRLALWYLFYSGKSVTKEKFEFETTQTFNWLKRNINNYEKNYYLKKKLKNEKLSRWLIFKSFIFLEKWHLTKLIAALYTL